MCYLACNSSLMLEKLVRKESPTSFSSEILCHNIVYTLQVRRFAYICVLQEIQEIQDFLNEMRNLLSIVYSVVWLSLQRRRKRAKFLLIFKISREEHFLYTNMMSLKYSQV